MTKFWKNTLSIMEANLKRKKDLIAGLEIPGSTFHTWVKKDKIPPADVALKIADLLGVSVRYLVTGEDDRELSTREKELLEQCRVLKEEKFKVVLDLAKSLRHDWEESQKVPSSASQDSREA